MRGRSNRARDASAGRRRWGGPVALLAGAAALLAAAWRPLLGVHDVDGRPPPRAPSSARELEARWDAVLEGGVVADGVVDYARLRIRRDELASLVGALGVYGPRSAPAAYRARDARLAYYVNAYNALVVFAVLEHEVRGSVHDVRGWIAPIDGLGFFWGQRFTLDGSSTHLFALEHDVLRDRFADARIHAAINCASASCPALAPRAYHGASLDAELDRAAAGLASPPHVIVDHARREVALSAIYDWYADDFRAHARELGLEPSVLAWIGRYAPARADLDRARRGGYAVRYLAYDWRLAGHW